MSERRLNSDEMHDLWVYISQTMRFTDAKRARNCDGTLKRVESWMRQRHVAREEATAIMTWLANEGGDCDCNVITEVLQRYIILDPRQNITPSA